MRQQLPVAIVASALAVASGGAVASADPAAEPAASTRSGNPIVERMVVLPGGRVFSGPARTDRTTVEVGRRTCAVAARTPMAALLQPRPARLRFVDYGSCSRRPVDATGLFVLALGRWVNRGLDGWVYKVGRKLGTAGAADPSGPFGNGRLRSGDRVVWFYCVFVDGSCQRSLEVAPRADGSTLTVDVKAYDDAGDGTAAAGAKVVLRTPRGRDVATATTDANGTATLTAAPGRYLVDARKRGAVRSFGERVTIG